MLKKSARLLRLLGDKAPPTRRDSNRITCASPHEKPRGHLTFEHKPILVGKIFHPGRSHGCCQIHATGDVIDLPSLLDIKKGAWGLWFSK